MLFEFLARRLKTPPYIILFVSDRCWMRCSHCWFNEEWKKAHLHSAVLEFDELKKTFMSIKRAHFVSLTGGEAFIRDDIVEIVNMMLNTSKIDRYDIPTSGYDTDSIVRKAQRMLEENKDVPFRIDVSIDGAGSLHDEIRGVRGAYGRAVKTVVELAKLRKKYSYFDLGIITTISAKNKMHIAQTPKEIEKILPDGEWMVNITRSETREPGAGEVETEYYAKAHEIIEHKIRSGRYKGHGGSKMGPWLSAKNAARRNKIIRIMQGTEKGGGCTAGSLAGVIYPDGEVRPCEMFAYSFGNLHDYDYDMQKIWSSDKAVQFRKNIRRNKCICTHECFLSVNMLFDPEDIYSIVRERIRLGKIQKGKRY